jgi:hypothetical protein
MATQVEITHEHALWHTTATLPSLEHATANGVTVSDTAFLAQQQSLNVFVGPSGRSRFNALRRRQGNAAIGFDMLPILGILAAVVLPLWDAVKIPQRRQGDVRQRWRCGTTIRLVIACFICGVLLPVGVSFPEAKASNHSHVQYVDPMRFCPEGMPTVFYKIPEKVSCQAFNPNQTEPWQVSLRAYARNVLK